MLYSYTIMLRTNQTLMYIYIVIVTAIIELAPKLSMSHQHYIAQISTYYYEEGNICIIHPLALPFAIKIAPLMTGESMGDSSRMRSVISGHKNILHRWDNEQARPHALRRINGTDYTRVHEHPPRTIT